MSRTILLAAGTVCGVAVALVVPSLENAQATCENPEWVVWSPELPNGDYPDEICSTWVGDPEDEQAEFSTVQRFEWCYGDDPELAALGFDESGTTNNISNLTVSPTWFNPTTAFGGENITDSGDIDFSASNQAYLTVEGYAWPPYKIDTKGITIYRPDDCP